MKICDLFKKITQLGRLIGMVILVVSAELGAMERAFPMEAQVFIKTNDNKVLRIARWKLDEMKGLLVLLEHQKGKNSEQNPINASMISSQEVELLSSALFKASELGDSFELFWHNLVEEDKKNGQWKVGQPLCPLQTLLVNAAQAVETPALSALCLSYFLHTDVQKKLLIPQFMDSVVSCLEGRKKIFLANSMDDIRAVACSPDGRCVAAAGHSDDGILTLWNAATGDVIKHLASTVRVINSMAFSPDGTKMVIGGGTNDLILLNLATEGIMHVFKGHPRSVNVVKFSPDGTKIISGCYGDQNNLIVWNAETGEKIKILEGHAHGVDAIDFNGDGTKFVSGSWLDTHNKLILWNATTGNIIKTFIVGQLAIKSVALSSDGTKIVVGCDGGANNLMILNAATGAKIHVLEGHPATVNTVAFSHDGRMIVSGSRGYRNNLILWDAKTGREIKVFENRPHAVTAVAFGPHDTKIVSACEEDRDNLTIWQLIPEQEIQNLENCNVAQARLMWQLCLRCSRKLPLMLEQGGLDCTLFMSLSKSVQELFKNFLGVTCGNKKIVEKQSEIVVPMAPQVPAHVREYTMEERQGMRATLMDPRNRTAENIAKLRNIYTELSPDYKALFDEIMEEMGLNK